jgi:nucleoside-diphosphate-sugar epimerase
MPQNASSDRHALVVGSTGIAGQALCHELVAHGWQVTGVSRRSPVDIPGVTPLLVDVTDPVALASALADVKPTAVFFAVWMRMSSEAENIRVNGGILRDVLAQVAPSGGLRHVSLMTGLKHYLGPFESYAKGESRETPFHEYEPRLDLPNFYYAQEDEMWASAAQHGFSWSVHRSHTVIGFAVGNAMNMGMTIAAQSALCKALGRPFVFPGNEVQWNGLTDMTDADLLARQMVWTAETEGLPSQAYNTANGDVFRWKWMWPRVAELLGVEPEGYDTVPRPLVEQMAGMESAWAELASREGLAETELSRVASWWHTDADLNRPLECFTDMANSRRNGFMDASVTIDSFAALFERLRHEKVIPS